MIDIINKIKKIANVLDDCGYIDCAADIDNILVKVAAISEGETERRLDNLIEQFKNDPDNIVEEIKKERTLSGPSSIGLWLQTKLDLELYRTSFYLDLKWKYDKLKNMIFLYAMENNLVEEEEETDFDFYKIKTNLTKGRIKIASEPKNIVVDVDGTIFEYDKYEFGKFGEPIEEVIEFLKQAKNDGYKLILFTARSWAEYDALEKALEDNDIGDFFDEIVMGKPIGKMYLDDRSINPLDEDWDSKAKELLGKRK